MAKLAILVALAAGLVVGLVRAWIAFVRMCNPH